MSPGHCWALHVTNACVLCSLQRVSCQCELEEGGQDAGMLGCRDTVMVRWAATFAECFVACLLRLSILWQGPLSRIHSPTIPMGSFQAEACLMLYACQLSALCSCFRRCSCCSYCCCSGKVLCFCSMKRKNSNKQRKLIFRQCRIIPKQGESATTTTGRTAAAGA